MVTALEKEFFEAFRIEHTLCGCKSEKCPSKTCDNCFWLRCDQITDSILLQLEQIILNSGLILMLKPHNNKFEYIVYEKFKAVGFCERENRRDALLRLAINIHTGFTSNGQAIPYRKNIYESVRALFEYQGVNND